MKEDKNYNIFFVIGGLAVLLLSGALFFFSQSTNEKAVEEKQLMVYVGSCMKNPIKIIADEFSKSNPGINITIVAKGTGMLMSNIKEWKRGDIFIPGEVSYAKEAIKNGYMERYTPLANHELTLIVPEGNPMGISSLEDITDNSVRVVAGGTEIAMGRMFRETTGDTPFYKQIIDNHMYAEETKCTRIAKSVANGLTDVGITCLASSFRVQGTDNINIKKLSNHQFIIPIGLLKFTKEKKASQQFINLVMSDYGKGVMKQHGFPPL